MLESEVDIGLSHERALAFLNSNFLTLDSHGDSLKASASDLASQYEALQHELDDYTVELQRFITESLEKAQNLLATAKETALARYAVTDDISSLKDELVSTGHASSLGDNSKTLLEEVEALHDRLDQLEQARTYLRVVQHGVQLSEGAVEEFKSPASGASAPTDASLQGYVLLHQFVVSVATACEPSSPREDPLSIVTFLYGLRSRTWREIKSVLFSLLLAAAERIKWPAKVNYLSWPSTERKDFENTFKNLLQLQSFGKRVHESGDVESEDPDGRPGLYPFQALVQPIAARFKFHFEGTRPTNRLDKPEWFFTHILNIIHEHKPFMEQFVQPLLSSSSYATVNAVHEFTYLLLPILSRKLKRTVPALLEHPSLLAHTIYQTLVFDGSVRDDGFSLEGTSETLNPTKRKAASHPSGWDGLSEVILGRADWFDAWLEGENRFADSIFNDIISSGEAWQLVDDGSLRDSESTVATVELRPTISARRVRALMEQITERYQHLPHLAHRLQFLLTVQLPILTSYLARITSSLDAYENLSSSFMRAVPGALAGQAGHGVDRARLTSGVEGLGRLFKAYVSATWVREAMEAWGEDLVFLELWAEINAKPALRERVAVHPSLPSTHSWESAEGTIFDEMIRQYAVLAARAEDMSVRQVYTEVETDLKGWISTFWEEEITPDEDDAALTSSLPASLLKPITSLSSSLTFLSNSLPSTQLSTAYKRIVGHIVGHMIQRLIYHRSKGRFSIDSGEKFKAQVGVWVDSCTRVLSPSAPRTSGNSSTVRRPEAAWSKLMDVATLLSLEEGAAAEVSSIVFDGGATAQEKFELAGEGKGLSGSLSVSEAADILRVRTDVRW
ncbi:hypothetical protein DL93DRAFT_2223365 [Clavulina sp. PMI_390]|nr:hypothetical protein DL93DRAFT_2223365 [Clavulina sp. PMI_390]